LWEPDANRAAFAAPTAIEGTLTAAVRAAS